MRYVNEVQPLWLRWFLNTENTDEAALRAALRVVPKGLWPSVRRDISNGLSELSTNVAKDAKEGELVDALVVLNPVLEMK